MTPRYRPPAVAVLVLATCFHGCGSCGREEPPPPETPPPPAYIEYGKNPPHVVRTQPFRNADDVPPGPVTLSIEFDRPLRTDVWSLCNDKLKAFPHTGGAEPVWTANGTVMSVAATLTPFTDYQLWINCPEFSLFSDAAGNRVEPTPWRFRTRGE